MKVILLFLSLCITSAQALESDNYLMWNRHLNDSTSEINNYLSDQIHTTLKKFSSRPKALTCEEVTFEIAKNFKTFLVHDNPMENWLIKHLDKDQIYPQTLNYLPQSIYRNPFRFYIPLFGLAPNIQVSDYYFGTDKLSHFSSTGSIYFAHFVKALNKGRTAQEAKEEAILWGINDELSVHGYWASGVFSFADLESNFQGLLFFKRLCLDEKNPYLRLVDQKWTMQITPDIRDYVNAQWDETFNPSYLLPKNWEKVSKVLKQDYCPHLQDSLVRDRMSYYQETNVESESMIFIQKIQLRPSSRVPKVNEQSFKTLCLR